MLEFSACTVEIQIARVTKVRLLEALYGYIGRTVAYRTTGTMYIDTECFT